MRPALDRLLNPRAVAIVGASDKPGALGASVLGNLERFGFAGDIHLINPNRPEIGGRHCLPSIDDLPIGVDAAVLAIPRAGVLDAVRALASREVGSVVIFAAGYAEGGDDGRAEQQEIARIAASAGMIVEGPNCLGLVNFVDGVPLTFIETAKARLGCQSGIGIVSQSGAIAAVLGTSLLSRQLCLSYSISTGNEAGSGVEDYVEFLVEDLATVVIGMVVEQFREPRRFLLAARKAHAAGKTIVLLHPGRSSAARESALTHTGAMAGDYALMAAKVEAAGVVLVETLEELGDCLEILARCRTISPRGPIVIGESGAFKALTLDLVEAIGLSLPPATDADSPGLRSALPDFVPVSNPIDMTAQGLVDPSLYGRLVDAGFGDDRFGCVFLGIIQTDATTCAIKFPAIIDALRATSTRKSMICAGLDDGAPVPVTYIEQLRALGVPYFPSSERALRAIARLLEQARREIVAEVDESDRAIPLASGTWPEHRAKQLLETQGIPFPDRQLVHDVASAQAAAGSLGFPVVLKAQSADLSHKSDVGGVVLGIDDEAALAEGLVRLQKNVARARPDLALDGVLIERMSPPGLEMIVGARNDPDWGAIVLVGFGGVHAEILSDVVLLTPGHTRENIIDRLYSLKSAALLRGFRGEPPRDVAALAVLVEQLGRLVLANPSIREIDLNPVIVYPEGAGVIALDALMLVA